MFGNGHTPREAPTFGRNLTGITVDGLGSHVVCARAHRSIASAMSWLFLGGLLPSRARLRFTRQAAP